MMLGKAFFVYDSERPCASRPGPVCAACLCCLLNVFGFSRDDSCCQVCEFVCALCPFLESKSRKSFDSMNGFGSNDLLFDGSRFG